MNQNHANRGKAARIARTATTVFDSLKRQGVKISPDQAAAATAAAADFKKENHKTRRFLYFESEDGYLGSDKKEWTSVSVERIKIRCENTQKNIDAANVYHAWRDNSEPWPFVIHGDADAIFVLLKEKIVNFSKAFYLRSVIEALDAEKVKKYGKQMPLHLVDLETVLNAEATES